MSYLSAEMLIFLKYANVENFGMSQYVHPAQNYEEREAIGQKYRSDECFNDVMKLLKDRVLVQVYEALHPLRGAYTLRVVDGVSQSAVGASLCHPAQDTRVLCKDREAILDQMKEELDRVVGRLSYDAMFTPIPQAMSAGGRRASGGHVQDSDSNQNPQASPWEQAPGPQYNLPQQEGSLKSPFSTKEAATQMTSSSSTPQLDQGRGVGQMENFQSSVPSNAPPGLRRQITANHHSKGDITLMYKS